MAKHVRFKTPKKATTMHKENVEYFVGQMPNDTTCTFLHVSLINLLIYVVIGSKAVDTLMESKWSKTSDTGQPRFVSRDDAINFMAKLLASKLFYRAERVQKLDKEEVCFVGGTGGVFLMYECLNAKLRSGLN